MDSDDEMRDTFDEHDIGDQNGACGRQMGQENRDYVHQGGAQALENSERLHRFSLLSSFSFASL